MVTFSQFSRALASSNLSSVKLDTIGRQFREAEVLAVRGRGPNAAHLKPIDVARISIGYCGAGKGVRAVERLTKLEGLRSDTDAVTLLDAVTALLTDEAMPADFVELRISRVRRRARLIYRDRLVTFTRDGRPLKHGRLEVEASLDAAVLSLVRGLLAGATPPATENEDDEDAD